LLRKKSPVGRKVSIFFRRDGCYGKFSNSIYHMKIDEFIIQRSGDFNAS